uniref:Uncharacterized protein n=1 Tax=Elaeophora elaphi TaxID=1147741 RepID=A0A0R3S6P8_9BILA
MEPGRRVTREIPDLSPTVLDTIPIIIASSPTMKASVGKKNRAENRRTAAEIDAFFTRLSTPKYIKGSFTPKLFRCVFSLIFFKLSVISGKVSKDKKVEDRVQLMSAAQRRRYEATKGLSVNVVRTRSNSVVRSGSHSSSIGN